MNYIVEVESNRYSKCRIVYSRNKAYDRDENGNIIIVSTLYELELENGEIIVVQDPKLEYIGR